MKSFVDIIDYLKQVKGINCKITESWSSLTFNGGVEREILKIYKDLHSLFTTLSVSTSIKLSLDSLPTTIDEVDTYISTNAPYNNWLISINKEVLRNKFSNTKHNYNFFFDKGSCIEWIKNQNPISADNKLNQVCPLRIIIHDLEKPFGTNTTQFLPSDAKFIDYKFGDLNSLLLSIDQIKENVNFVTNESIAFNVNSYAFLNGDYSDLLAQQYLRYSNKALALTVINEYYSQEKIVIDGIRRTTLFLEDGHEGCSHQFNWQMSELVRWLYEDRVSTRKKLFLDRLTLELSDGESLINLLNKSVSDALEQAKSRYNFVILDRKDAYIKELKELLKDIKGQSELYSNKVRTLVGNFLRDILAGIILIGFTIFTKFSDHKVLENAHLLEYVFLGLTIYYIVSILFQAITDWTDILISKKELKYWKTVSTDFIQEQEFKRHVRSSLTDRILSAYVLYSVIAVLYFLVAFACFKFPSVFEMLSSKSNAINIH